VVTDVVNYRYLSKVAVIDRQR